MALFAGAPLDVVKLAAATLMLCDHVNTILLGSSAPLLWRIGRIAFPLFCFALVCHLARGANPWRYVQALLVLAIPTQPIFAAAFSNELANILFTLAAGATLATVLLAQPPWVPHAALALGTAAVFAWPLAARTGVDFGVAGILFPAALLLTLARSPVHGVWLVALLLGLNAAARRGPEESWLAGLTFDGLFAGFGGLAVIACAAAFRGKRRFLPRYALHVFYPGHLVALVAVRGFAAGA
jgi:TraX protein